MSYFYEDFAVKENTKSYVVTRQIPGDEEVMKVRINKELIEKINSNEDSEMIAIVCAMLEFARFDAKACNKPAENRIITSDEFVEKLNMELSVKNVEDIITDISGQKFHELKEFFS